jgi:uncharacterized phiE125 gp8 family phage protein
MRIEIVSAPEVEPITLAEARTYCRIDADLTDEDELLGQLITIAREKIEGETSRAFAPQTLRATFDGFPPRSGILQLPRFPLVGVTSVVYDDASGEEQTFSASLYSVVTSSMPGAIYCPGSWPSVRPGPGSVRITFTAGNSLPPTGEGEGEGEGEAWAGELIPQRARLAMLYLVNHFYENRGGTPPEATEIPAIVKSMVFGLRVWFRSHETD